MKQKLDKLGDKLKENKKMLIFFLGIMITGIIAGTFFVVLLKQEDKILLKEYMTNYITSIKDGKLNYLSAFWNTIIMNFFSVISIWLLGLSVIGIPLILFSFFIKTFILGFSVASLIQQFGIKGILTSFFFLFPHQVLNIILFLILLLYAISISLEMIKSFQRKEAFDFGKIKKTYFQILFLSLFGFALTAVMEVFFTPFFLQLILPILK